MKRNSIILCLCWAMQFDQIEPAYQDACFFENRLCLQAPTTWIRQNHFSRYSDYTRIFDARFISKDSGSQVTVTVTDKKYNPSNIGVQPYLDAEKKSDSVRWRHFELMDSGIEKRGDYEFGFIKYQFLYRGKKRYMITSLFFDKDGNQYTMEISSLTLTTEKFRETAEHIYRSLKLN